MSSRCIIKLVGFGVNKTAKGNNIEREQPFCTMLNQSKGVTAQWLTCPIHELSIERSDFWDSHVTGAGMLVDKFELNPKR